MKYFLVSYNIFSVFYVFQTNIQQTSYKLPMNIFSYELLKSFQWTSYKLLTNIFQSSYELLYKLPTNFLQTY
jgi:hypothetical protein